MNLVLCHGIFGFSTFAGITYFDGVEEHLNAKFPGLRILVTQVPPDGTIVARGTELGRQIGQELEPGGALDSGEQVHIIAHSMGGLDARFLLSPDNDQNKADRIISLTTISTPHRGSPIADLLAPLLDPSNIGTGENPFAQSVRASLALARIEVGGLHNITTKGTEHFNNSFHDNDLTKKFSVAGVGRGIKILGIGMAHDTCAALHLPHSFIKDKTGEDNDGLVTLSSATWGTAPELWPADHADEIGHDLDRVLDVRPRHFEHLSRYEALVRRLM